MKTLILIIALFMPTFATAEYWSTVFPAQKKLIFDVVRKGTKISEWSTPNGRLHMLIDFKGELYVCIVQPASSSRDMAMEIFCRDAN